jgi:hypothetical protein
MNATVKQRRVQVPQVAKPAPAVEAKASLPEWIAPLLLAGLVAASGLIVLVGWFVVAAPEGRGPSDARRNKSSLGPRPAPLVPSPTMAAEAMVIEDKPPPPILLSRRTQERPEEPMAVATPLPKKVEAPVERVIAPLVWTTEPARVGGTILPIEIARIEAGTLPHNVRRLRLDDEAPRPLKVAMTPFVHDDLGSVLIKMGDGYRYTTIRNEDLLSLSTLKKYDVVFLTCADLYARDFESAGTLRRFVHEGGTLYASDLRGDLVLAAFPEFRSRMPVLPGVPQNVEASVLDPGLQSHLGRKTIPLSFEADGWRPAAFDGTKVEVCLRGTYRNQLGQTKLAPLLVKFRVQKGTVIFTSFHHAKNDGPIVRKLLDYLVFTTMTARSEARVRDLMAHSRFAPLEIRPLLLTPKEKVVATYEHIGGGLQIALGFEHVGAKMKLMLRSPMGQKIEYELQGVYQIEVPEAAPGLWQYTVTPLELPYSNFPVMAAIGGIKS